VLGVGLPPTSVQIPVRLWGSRGLTFIRKCECDGLGNADRNDIACNIGSRQELIECLDLAVRHNIKPIIEVCFPSSYIP
jgi:D-arabinose 1-dehydrogenase-like Zn-dependent alcohol dehydrogenase